MNKSDIVLLPIGQLHPHPENPRKDVGDVTELSESIKVNGILQNLTVVPGHYDNSGFQDGDYTVIIGHRRLAAAKKAGMAELPCTIVQMSAEEQVATMLTENMQRENLTIYEQAKAFQQLSIDFGKSVSEIAEMSGFSENTVRRRTKLAGLNEVAFKRACDRGATLFEFAELDKLELPEDKAKVLADMGTPNFRNTLKEALAGQRYRHKREEWIKALRTFATEIETEGYCDGKHVQMNYYRTYGSWTPKSEEISRPEDADSVRYFFKVSECQISVYKEAKTSPAEAARQAEQKRREDEAKNRWASIQDISSRHRELRREFVANFGQAQRFQQEIATFAADAMLWEAERQYYADLGQKSAAKILGIPYDTENECMDKEAFDALKADKPIWVVLVLAYWFADTGCSYISHVWSGTLKCWEIRHEESKRLDRIYKFLKYLGYEMSDEEKQLQDGTHPLFTREEGQGDV